MTIRTRVRQNPMQGHAFAMLNAERTLAQLQSSLFSRGNRRVAAAEGFVPTLKAVENPDDYVVSAEVPGVAPEDLSVVVEEGVLTLRGVRKSLDWSEDLADEEKGALSSSFERSVRFNGEIDEGRVTARSKDGLLQIVVPKPEPPVSEALTIPIQTG